MHHVVVGPDELAREAVRHAGEMTGRCIKRQRLAGEIRAHGASRHVAGRRHLLRVLALLVR